MKVTYLGPYQLADHPALDNLDPHGLPPSCYLVEVSAEAGVAGPIIEGDVLVVDEARPVEHAALVVVELDNQYRLYRSHRIGGGFRLMPASGGQGHIASAHDCRGVVVQHLRQQATA
jgi:SOS-response transcriptional repressor LexA